MAYLYTHQFSAQQGNDCKTLNRFNLISSEVMEWLACLAD